MDSSLDLYTYRVSCMVSGADRVDIPRHPSPTLPTKRAVTSEMGNEMCSQALLTASCFVVLQRVNEEWTAGEKRRTKATFLSSRAVDCSIPRLSHMAVAAMEFLADEQPYARWEIAVSNDGVVVSNTKVLTLYDGVCQQCVAAPTGLCQLKDRTCNIEGMCFSDGDVSPSSPCLLCNSSASRYTWTINQGPPQDHHRTPTGPPQDQSCSGSSLYWCSSL
ncbi:hypothetical protein NFI96_009511 [Prochilodus magdalenae]|nr:hypothetical protein NFI96_009511 [Prochilodus magdalenae]